MKKVSPKRLSRLQAAIAATSKRRGNTMEAQRVQAEAEKAGRKLQRLNEVHASA